MMARNVDKGTQSICGPLIDTEKVVIARLN